MPQKAAMPVITHPEESCVPHTTTVRESIKSSGVTCGKVKSALLPLTALIHLVSVSLNVAQRPNPASRNIKMDMPVRSPRPGYLRIPRISRCRTSSGSQPTDTRARRAIERVCTSTEDQGHNHPSLHNPTLTTWITSAAAQKSVPQASTLPKAAANGNRPSVGSVNVAPWHSIRSSGNIRTPH